MNRLLVLYQLDNSCIPRLRRPSGRDTGTHVQDSGIINSDAESAAARGILIFKHRRD